MRLFSNILRMLLIVLLAGILTGLFAHSLTSSSRDPTSFVAADKIVIAIENSRSVTDAELLPYFKEATKAGLEALLNFAGAGKKIAVLSFGTEVYTSVELTTLNESSLPHVSDAIDHIVDTTGWTYTAGAIDRACDILLSEPGTGGMVLLTNGKPTTDGSDHGDEAAAAEAALESADYFKENCSILAVIAAALEEEAEEFLEEISNDGLDLFPPSYDEIADELLRVLTSLTFPPQVERIQFPQRIIGDKRKNWGKVHFSDFEGDINHAYFRAVGGTGNWSPFDFPVEGKKKGSFDFYIWCETDRRVTARFEVTLTDEKGNTSKPKYFSFSCVPP